MWISKIGTDYIDTKLYLKMKIKIIIHINITDVNVIA